MTVQCCMCHKVRDGQRWQRSRDAASIARQASHTFCPRCEQKFRHRWGLAAK